MRGAGVWPGWLLERARDVSQDTEGRTGNGNEILRFEHVLVDTELPRTPEVHGHETFEEAFYFSDTVIDG